MSSASAMESENLAQQHQAALIRVQERVKFFYDHKQQFRIYHGSTSSTRTTRFSGDAIVDTSDMTRIFDVDVKAKTVKAEPNVPMNALVAHTLKYNLVPKVVMELKGITVGGGYSSVSGESSMFKYGLFQQTISEIEVVLADGRIEHATKSRNTDLLEGAGGNMGTLGIITLLTVELIEATPFVDLELRHVNGVTNITNDMENVIQEDVDYIDGILFESGQVVLMIGRLIAKPETAMVLSKKEVHWFADSIEAAMKGGVKHISMRIEDYLFRYDHGAFWGAKLAFKHFHIPNNRLTRKLADPLLDSRTCYHALHKTGLASEYVVQDFGIPSSNVPEFIRYVKELMPTSQLFLCPGQPSDQFRIAAKTIPHLADVSNQRLFGIGVYGRGPRSSTQFLKLNRDLEQKAGELRGIKVLYARVYYTEKEFWRIYDKHSYDELREKYGASTLPTVYDKLHADMASTGKLRPIRGIAETVWDKVVGQKNYILRK